MASYPPFMNSYGQIEKILTKIRSAQAPQRFTQDFLASKLGFKGGSTKAFIPLAKRLGLIASDGAPTDLYHKFRNPTSSRRAMADAVRKGYAELYSRNEYAHELNEKELRGLVMESTGLDEDAATLRAITKSFLELCKLAKFDATDETHTRDAEIVTREVDALPHTNGNGLPEAPPIGVGLSYTINLNLPETADIAVFNAIFKSLRENLLRRS